MIIRDPQTGTGAEVTDEKRLRVDAIAESEALHANEDGGVHFCATLSRTPTGAADVFFYLKNTSTKLLIIDQIDIYAASAESIKAYLGDAGTPSGGSTLTPANLNAGSGSVADCTCQDGVNITTLSGGVALCELYGSTTMVQYPFPGGIIVPRNKVLTLYSVTGAVAIKVNVWFYFHE